MYTGGGVEKKGMVLYNFVRVFGWAYNRGGL